ncbi:MAG: hypothetical protein ACI9RG_000438 [Sulfurimonas sp.]|jgi:hypothetical protein
MLQNTSNLKTIFLILSLLVIPVSVFGHGDNKHIEKTKVVAKTDITKDEELRQTHASINSNYIKNIKPIFEKKCFDCHGSVTTFPWYYKVPGVKQMMDYDIKEAKKHMDMSKDFPFISHDTTLKDLESLNSVSIKNEMPPLRYLLGHWDARLDKSEQEKIGTWTKDSIKQIKEVSYE